MDNPRNLVEVGERVSEPVGLQEPIKLKRVLGLWDLIMIGIVIIQPIAPMGIYDA